MTDDKRIIYEVSYHHWDGVVTTWFDMVEPEETMKFENNGIQYTLVKNKEGLWAEWRTDSNVSYLMFTTEDWDTVKDIIINLEKE